MIPETREEITLPWLNSIFKPHGIRVHEFAFIGEASNGRGFMGTLEQVELEISRPPNHSESTSLPSAPDCATSDQDNQTSRPTETLHIILKTLPNDPHRKSYAANDGFSSREVSMYVDVFPAWEKFLEERQVPLAQRFRYPFCYYGAEEGDRDTYKYILVLENLTAPQSNFHLWTGGFTDPLPWPAASTVIREIARFHATGIAFKKENCIDSYSQVFPKLIHPLSPAFNYQWNSGFEIAKKVIQETVDKHEIPPGIFEQLDKLQADESRDLLLKWFIDPTLSTGESESICHQDLHSNNLVLSKDHQSAALFDYQACVSFNPMNDVSFFLMLNCLLEDATEKLPRALQAYHDEFSKTMTAIKTDFKYSLERIKMDYDWTVGFSIAHIMTGAIIWVIGQNSTVDSKRRFAMNVIDAYKRGVLTFPTHVLK